MKISKNLFIIQIEWKKKMKKKEGEKEENSLD